MSIYRHKRSPYWQFDFEIEHYRFRGSTKCRDACDAQAFEAAEKIAARELVGRLTAEGREPLRLKAACERWWTEHGSSLSDAKVKSVLDRLVAIMGNPFLHAIRDDDVSRMVQARRQDTRRDRTIVEGGKRKILYRPITARTVNRTIDLLRQVMYRARDNWNVAIVRMPVWKKHKLKVDKTPIVELTRAQEATLDAREGADYAELRRFATITGLRKRNLFLTWNQVDFELAAIRVRTKGGVWRTIPMTREIYAMLWRRRDHHPEFVWTFVARRTFEIPKSKGGGKRIKGQRYPMTYYGFTTHCRSWKQAGINLRIHGLRHTAGMRTLRQTRNLKLVQTLLGHSTIKTTADFYVDATLEDLRAGMEETTAPPASYLKAKPKRF